MVIKPDHQNRQGTAVSEDSGPSNMMLKCNNMAYKLIIYIMKYIERSLAMSKSWC